MEHVPPVSTKTTPGPGHMALVGAKDRLPPGSRDLLAMANPSLDSVAQVEEVTFHWW